MYHISSQMFPVANMITQYSHSLSEEASCVSSFGSFNYPLVSNVDHQQTHHKIIKRKRNLPGNPDPSAEVIALSPKTLLTTNRFVCEICKKGFQRDQNLQLHRRGHNLPWKLKQRNDKDVVIKKKAYVCPEPSCVHHHPSRALGDLTGIKKHFCRKHGEKKWKCDKCSKIYAVQSDWKAHTKTCGTREYKCDCGTLFSRKDSFLTHRAFCEALAEESARVCAAANIKLIMSPSQNHISWDQPPQYNNNIKTEPNIITTHYNYNMINTPFSSPSSSFSPLLFHQDPIISNTCSFDNNNNLTAQLSATALLQKAAMVGAHAPGHVPSAVSSMDMGGGGGGGAHVTAGSLSPEWSYATWQQKSEGLTRDFLGLTRSGTGTGVVDRGRSAGSNNVDVNVNVNVNFRDLLSYAGEVQFPTYDVYP